MMYHTWTDEEKLIVATIPSNIRGDSAVRWYNDIAGDRGLPLQGRNVISQRHYIRRHQDEFYGLPT